MRIITAGDRVRALAACKKFKEVHKFGKCQFEATAALWVVPTG
jgi:hypothetical protein